MYIMYSFLNSNWSPSWSTFVRETLIIVQLIVNFIPLIWTQSWATWIQLILSYCIFSRAILILLFSICPVSPKCSVYFRVCWSKFYLFFSFSSLCARLLDLVTVTKFDECKGYKVSHAVFPNFLSLYATWFHILSLPPCSQMPMIYILPLWGEVKFHTHEK